MKKLFTGIIVLSMITACREDDVIIDFKKDLTQKEHEKTTTTEKLSNTEEAYKKETDSIKPVKPLLSQPETGINPGTGTDPGEVGPIVTIPPK